MIITLLSDLGMRDPSVALARAAIIQHVPDATIIDVTHEVIRDDVQQAAYLLLSAYRSFEKGTVHIAAIDVFAGRVARMLMVKKDGHYFIAPDNGMLPLAFGGALENVRLCFEFTGSCGLYEWMDRTGTVAAAIAEGWILPYPQCAISVLPEPPGYVTRPYGLECRILHIDRYKNVVLAITKKQFEKAVGNRPFRIRIVRLPDIVTVGDHYGDVPDGSPICRFNSVGYLEIAINHGNMAALLGLDPLLPGVLKYKVVRIFLQEQ